MTIGITTTGSLADSLPTLIASARITREMEGVMPQLVDKVTLGKGTGPTWNEVKYDQVTAQPITETTVLDNPQQLSDSLLSITPTVVGVMTVITDRVADRITKNGLAKTGSLAQNAMQRKKDEDGLVVLDGFSNSYCGAGSTLTSGHIAAAMALITGNATETAKPPYRCVLHPYQIHDIEDEIVAGVGTYPVAEGLTARVFTEGFRGMIAGAQLYPDGNIVEDSGNDMKGGVFAQEAIVLVQGRSPRMTPVRDEALGGGATKIYHYDEYSYGERLDTWGAELFSDGIAPTS